MQQNSTGLGACRTLDAPEQAIQLRLFVEAITINRVSSFPDLSLAAPIPKRVRDNTEVLGCLLDGHVLL